MTRQDQLSWCGEEDISVSLLEAGTGAAGGFVPHADSRPGQRRQQLFSGYPEPEGSPLPSVALLATAVPRVLAHALLALASRGLCPSPLTSSRASCHLCCPTAWSGWRRTPGQGSVRLWRGCSHGANPGAAPHPRCCPGRSTSPPAAPAAPFLRGSSAQPWHSTSAAISKHGSVPPGLLSARAARSVSQSKPLTPGWAQGCWWGDRRCPRHSGFEDKQSSCSPWLPPALTWKEKLLYAAEELLIHPPRLCSGPCLCIPT